MNVQMYRWRIVAANGEILATSAASYRSAADAHKAASLLTAAVREATIVDAEDTDDQDQAAHRIAS